MLNSMKPIKAIGLCAVLLAILSMPSSFTQATASATKPAMGILVVPYFPPTSTDWNVIYQQASAHPGTIKFIIINPCGGPCSGSNALSPDWQKVISTLKSSDHGIQT